MLSETVKTSQMGLMHYNSLYLLRKLIYALIVYHLTEEVYLYLQIATNALLSIGFAVYLAVYQPFLTPYENKLAILNEFNYYVVSLLYFCFTDFNPNPEVKNVCGWVVVLVAIANLLYPNLYLMVEGLIPELRSKCMKKRRSNSTRD